MNVKYPLIMNIKYPHIEVQLVGTDGNAFAIIAKVRQAMHRAGISIDGANAGFGN